MVRSIRPVDGKATAHFDHVELRQMRRHSLLEAIANTAVGFTLSNIAWPAVQVLILHQRYNPLQGLGAITVFTVLSVARNYATRRFFNHHHKAQTYEYRCEAHYGNQGDSDAADPVEFFHHDETRPHRR